MFTPSIPFYPFYLIAFFSSSLQVLFIINPIPSRYIPYHSTSSSSAPFVPLRPSPSLPTPPPPREPLHDGQLAWLAGRISAIVHRWNCSPVPCRSVPRRAWQDRAGPRGAVGPSLARTRTGSGGFRPVIVPVTARGEARATRSVIGSEEGGHPDRKSITTRVRMTGKLIKGFGKLHAVLKRRSVKPVGT